MHQVFLQVAGWYFLDIHQTEAQKHETLTVAFLSWFSFGRFRSKGLIGNRTRHTPYSPALLVLIVCRIVFQFSITLVAVTSFFYLVAEGFISFMFHDLSRVFRCGNKLLSWPKTNGVVDVLLAGTIIILLHHSSQHSKHTKFGKLTPD